MANALKRQCIWARRSCFIYQPVQFVDVIRRAFGVKTPLHERPDFDSVPGGLECGWRSFCTADYSVSGIQTVSVHARSRSGQKGRL